MFHTDALNKSSSLLVISMCFLHSHDHRHLMYGHRVLQRNLNLDFTAFFLLPTPAYSNNPAYQLPLMFPAPPHIPTPWQLGTSEYSVIAGLFLLCVNVEESQQNQNLLGGQVLEANELMCGEISQGNLTD